MKPRQTFVAVGLASALLLTSALSPVSAADVTTKTQASQTTEKTRAAATTTAENAGQSVLLRTSEEIGTAIREARAARVAIFNGATDDATKLATAAKTNLESARNGAQDLSIKTAKSQASEDHFVPFDVSIALAEGFQPTDEKVAHLKKANEHMAKGDQKKAAEVLKLANIDVTVSAAVLPIEPAVSHAEDAVKLMNEGKLYEANLALKAIEDSVTVEAFSIGALPTQGTTAG